MTALIRLCFFGLLGPVVVAACSDDRESTGNTNTPSPTSTPTQCGGCALPPRCNPDGTSPPAPCSCGCTAGDTRFSPGFVCTDRGCLAPISDGGSDAAADAADAS